MVHIELKGDEVSNAGKKKLPILDLTATFLAHLNLRLTVNLSKTFY